MKSGWERKMSIGDLVEFEESFYNSMKQVADIRRVGLIIDAREMFYCVSTGTVNDLWVSPPDIKKICLDKIIK